MSASARTHSMPGVVLVNKCTIHVLSLGLCENRKFIFNGFLLLALLTLFSSVTIPCSIAEAGLAHVDALHCTVSCSDAPR